MAEFVFTIIIAAGGLWTFITFTMCCWIAMIEFKKNILRGALALLFFPVGPVAFCFIDKEECREPAKYLVWSSSIALAVLIVGGITLNLLKGSGS